MNWIFVQIEKIIKYTIDGFVKEYRSDIFINILDEVIEKTSYWKL